MKSTGPILMIGVITTANMTILHSRPFNWRVPIATAAAALLFAGAEKVWEPGAVGMAWVALVTSLIVPLEDGVPSPAQSAQQWWAGGSPATATGPRYIYT